MNAPNEDKQQIDNYINKCQSFKEHCHLYLKQTYSIRIIYSIQHASEKILIKG